MLPKNTPKDEPTVEKTIGQEVAAALKEALPALMQAIVPATIVAMEQAKSQTTHDLTMKARKATLALGEKCGICRQLVGDGKTRGCGGPWAREADGTFKLDNKGARIEDYSQFHELMVVFPNDPVAEQQFDGVQINGAHYCSSGPNHKVWVPKQNDIAAHLLNFEEDQRAQRVGRKHIRQSGSISGNGGQQVSGPTFA